MGARFLAAALIAAAFFLPALPAQAATKTYTVTSETDAPDITPGDGICSAIVSASFVGNPPVLSFKFGCTLRAALMEDAADNAATTINFAAGMAGKTIHLTTANGALALNSDDTALNGEIDGNPATWDVTIDGSALAGASPVFLIKGSYAEVDQLVLQKGPGSGVEVYDAGGPSSANILTNLVVVGMKEYGVYFHGSQSLNNHLRTSYIGARPENVAAACVLGDGNGTGVYVGGGADSVTLFNNKLIGCSEDYGVVVLGADTAETTILFNLIGGENGHQGNGRSSIYISNAQNTSVTNNTVTSSEQAGIEIGGQSTRYLLIDGNVIGLSMGAGTVVTPAPNGYTGIWLHTAAIADAIISNNVIGFNENSGILIDTTAAVTVTGNYVGIEPVTGAAVANFGNGIAVHSATGVVIGGDTGGERNVVGNCPFVGIYLGNSEVQVEGNYVGVDPVTHAVHPNDGGILTAGDGYILGAVGPLVVAGNQRFGIEIGGAKSVIGENAYVGYIPQVGAPLAAGNQGPGVVMAETASANLSFASSAYNTGAGYLAKVVSPNASHDNLLFPRAVFANGGLPIDLQDAGGNEGATANDAGDVDAGANGLLNYPVMTGANGAVISGSAPANASVMVYALHDPAHPTKGGRFVIAATSDANGQWLATIPNTLPWQQVLLMSCTGVCAAGSTNHNSSELSPLTTNLPPAGLADGYAANPNAPLSVAALHGVLANDSDPEALPLKAQIAVNPAHGSVALSADGSFLYTPAAGFAGSDSFSYRAIDSFNNVSVIVPVNVVVQAGAEIGPLALDEQLWLPLAQR
jgi:hypothetical protein